MCCKKKIISLVSIRLFFFAEGFNHKSSPSQIDLNAVRVCFQVFLQGAGHKFNIVVPPVVSEPIYDKSALIISVIALSDYVFGHTDGNFRNFCFVLL